MGAEWYHNPTRVSICRIEVIVKVQASSGALANPLGLIKNEGNLACDCLSLNEHQGAYLHYGSRA